SLLFAHESDPVNHTHKASVYSRLTHTMKKQGSDEALRLLWHVLFTETDYTDYVYPTATRALLEAPAADSLYVGWICANAGHFAMRENDETRAGEWYAEAMQRLPEGAATLRADLNHLQEHGLTLSVHPLLQAVSPSDEPLLNLPGIDSAGLEAASSGWFRQAKKQIESDQYRRMIRNDKAKEKARKPYRFSWLGLGGSRLAGPYLLFNTVPDLYKDGPPPQLSLTAGMHAVTAGLGIDKGADGRHIHTHSSSRLSHIRSHNESDYTVKREIPMERHGAQLMANLTVLLGTFEIGAAYFPEAPKELHFNMGLQIWYPF
ncbi:MAG: hypothetical protein GY772_05295, partial [bacterium]|nr:hypothetical protein [bacterium]